MVSTTEDDGEEHGYDNRKEHCIATALAYVGRMHTLNEADTSNMCCSELWEGFSFSRQNESSFSYDGTVDTAQIPQVVYTFHPRIIIEKCPARLTGTRREL